MLLASTFSEFLASGLFVWALATLVVIMLFIATSNDSLSFAFWVTVAGLAGFQILTEVDPWGFVKENPKALGLAAFLYLPAGVLWSFYRWWRLLKNTAADLVAEKKEGHWGGRSPSDWTRHKNAMMPSAAKNKGRISCWIGYWPFSIASYLLVDLLGEIGNWIYVQISGAYQRMADSIKASIGDL